MRFQFGIGHQLASADASAVDDQIEFVAHILQASEMNISLEFTTGRAETRREIIQINGGVGQGNFDLKSAGKAGRWFDCFRP